MYICTRERERGNYTSAKVQDYTKSLIIEILTHKYFTYNHLSVFWSKPFRSDWRQFYQQRNITYHTAPASTDEKHCKEHQPKSQLASIGDWNHTPPAPIAASWALLYCTSAHAQQLDHTYNILISSTSPLKLWSNFLPSLFIPLLHGTVQCHQIISATIYTMLLPTIKTNTLSF